MADDESPEESTPAPPPADAANGNGPPLTGEVMITVDAAQRMQIRGNVPSQDILEGMLLRALAYVQREQLIARIRAHEQGIQLARGRVGDKPSLFNPFPGRG